MIDQLRIADRRSTRKHDRSERNTHFHYMLIFLVWWRSVPVLIHLDNDRQACIKTGLIPAGHLQGIALFYPAYAAGIRLLQAGGTVQTDHVGRFPKGVTAVTQL